MLTKVTNSNYLLGTGNIISYTKLHCYDIIQDNLHLLTFKMPNT